MKFEKYFELPDTIKIKMADFDNANFDTEETEDPDFDEYVKEHYFSKSFAYVIAWEGEEIVGTSHLKKRECEFEGRKFVLGGQGGITVRKDKRGQGIGKALLLKSLELFYEENCDIAFLNTDIEKLGPMFEKAGYQLYPKSYLYVGRSGKVYSDNNAMLAPVKSEEIFKLIMNSDVSLNIGEGNI